MPLACPRCRTANPDVARYCRNCGLTLEVGSGGVLGAGRAPHPQPLSPPDGSQPIGNAANLHFTWGAAGGGAPLLGTESLVLTVFNAGYGLAEVALRVRGTGDGERTVFEVARELEDWPRGASARLEIPSYEMPDRVRAVSAELVQAEFGTDDE